MPGLEPGTQSRLDCRVKPGNDKESKLGIGPMSNPKPDPIDYAVISQALIAAAREMGAKLIRSAYSTILREARDGSAARRDARGKVVAQAELIPMHLGSLGYTFAPCAEMYPIEELTPDDFYVTNHPYYGASTCRTSSSSRRSSTTGG